MLRCLRNWFVGPFSIDWLTASVIDRWVGMAGEILSSCVVLFTVIFAVLQRDSLSAGLAGLAVTYALQVRAWWRHLIPGNVKLVQIPFMISQWTRENRSTAPSQHETTLSLCNVLHYISSHRKFYATVLELTDKLAAWYLKHHETSICRISLYKTYTPMTSCDFNYCGFRL